MPETQNQHSRDYLERTIETVRNHRTADNSWPQWANAFADEIERLWGIEEQYQAALRAVGCDHTLRNDDDKQDALWEYVHHDGGTWIRCKGCGTLERWEGGFRFEVRLEPVSNPAMRPPENVSYYVEDDERDEQGRVAFRKSAPSASGEGANAAGVVPGRAAHEGADSNQDTERS